MKKIIFSAFFFSVAATGIKAQNVGIGTTTPASRLHIFSADTGMVRIENSTTLAAGVSNAIYFKTGTWFTGGIKHTGTGTNVSRTGFYGFASTTTAGLREYMSITDAGDVGINTTTPGTQLQVSTASNDYGFSHTDGIATIGTYIGTPSGGTLGGWLGTNTTHPLYLYTSGGAPQATLTTGGIFSIGNNTPLNAGLVVDKKIGATNAIFGSNTTGVDIESNFPGIGLNSYYNGGRKFMGTGYGGVIGFDPTAGGFTFASSTASGTAGVALTTTNAMTISNQGSTYIQGTDAGYIFADRTLTNYGGWNWYADQGKAYLYRYNSGGNLLMVDQSGNLGVGTTTPGARLEVNGQVKITGGIPATGSVLTSDATGLATWKSPVMKSASLRLASQQIVNSGGSISSVLFTDVAGNAYNDWPGSVNNSTGMFTVPPGEDGTYRIDVQLKWKTSNLYSGMAEFDINLRRNGAFTIADNFTDVNYSSNGLFMHLSQIVKLAAGGNLILSVLQSTGATQFIENTDYDTYMNISRIN